jgi:hypothetical protein
MNETGGAQDTGKQNDSPFAVQLRTSYKKSRSSGETALVSKNNWK